jgi:CBS domain-containing protein
MEIELQEIADFVSAIPPFDRLPQIIIERLTKKLTIRYIRRGAKLPPEDVTRERLYILRKGAISLISKDNKLLGKLGEGDICTVFCLLDERDNFSIQVEEDTLVYVITCDAFNVVLKDYPEELSYFQKSASERLNQRIVEKQEKNTLSSSLMQTAVENVLNKPVITAETNISIRDAAIILADNNISAVVILKDEKVAGILSEKDITKRCIAKDVPLSNSVEQIMTTDIISVESDTNAFEAMMIMTRKQIRHLPVIDNQQLNGIISVTDILRLEGRNSVYLINAISKAESIEILREHSKALPLLQLQLVQMGSTPDHIGKIITAISSAITRRLIELAVVKLGPAPVPYVWVAAGSHARREQSSHSDQDNALIISDRMKPEDDVWFAALAKFVCDGLDQCGYIYCPGDVMAINSKWRQPAKQWSDYFSNWITTPSPKALMYSSIFFDLRAVTGDESLLENIRKKMLLQSPNNDLFLAHLTFNALKLKPPLGFFRDFVLVHDGKHNDTLDLKHNGLAPIVDLARIYSLAEGIDEVNTIERLKQASGTKSLSKEGAENLLDAFEFISNLRIEHQALQISNGLESDNYMSPAEVSKLERDHLKDAFKVIQTLQTYVEMRYKIG